METHRLIAVTLGKMAASRSQRGGLRLHKSLLVASVLVNARTAYMVQRCPSSRDLLDADSDATDYSDDDSDSDDDLRTSNPCSNYWLEPANRRDDHGNVNDNDMSVTELTLDLPVTQSMASNTYAECEIPTTAITKSSQHTVSTFDTSPLNRDALEDPVLPVSGFVRPCIPIVPHCDLAACACSDAARHTSCVCNGYVPASVTMLTDIVPAVYIPCDDRVHRDDGNDGMCELARSSSAFITDHAKDCLKYDQSDVKSPVQLTFDLDSKSVSRTHHTACTGYVVHSNVCNVTSADLADYKSCSVERSDCLVNTNLRKRRLSDCEYNDDALKRTKTDLSSFDSCRVFETLAPLTADSCTNTEPMQIECTQINSLVHSFSAGFSGLSRLPVPRLDIPSKDMYDSADLTEHCGLSKRSSTSESIISCSVHIREALETLSRPIIALTV